MTPEDMFERVNIVLYGRGSRYLCDQCGFWSDGHFIYTVKGEYHCKPCHIPNVINSMMKELEDKDTAISKKVKKMQPWWKRLIKWFQNASGDMP
jgi:hypothetical protein